MSPTHGKLSCHNNHIFNDRFGCLRVPFSGDAFHAGRDWRLERWLCDSQAPNIKGNRPSKITWLNDLDTAIWLSRKPV
jgi:hypothetical protein